MLSKAFLIVGLVAAGPVIAADGEGDYLQALEETQKVLTQPTLRTQAAQSPEAKAALDTVSQIAGTPENEQALFDLAAQIFGSLTKEAKGDPDKIEKVLVDAQKNPEGFFNKLNPQQQKEIQGLAKKIGEPKSGKGPLP